MMSRLGGENGGAKGYRKDAIYFRYMFSQWAVA